MEGRGKHFQAWRNRTTIRKQLSLLVGIAVSLTMALLISFHYATQAAANQEQQRATMRRVLQLESRRLDDYVAELRTFSLQLRNDTGFMALAARTATFPYAERQGVEALVKASFYARADITAYELYLVRQRQRYAMDARIRKVAFSEDVEISLLPDYAAFTAKPDFCHMTADAGGFLQVTRTIIDAPRETPLAVVRFSVGTEVIEGLARNHLAAGEMLCVFGSDGERYFQPEGLEEAENLWRHAGPDVSSGVASLGGEQMLWVAVEESASDFVLIGLKPMELVNAALIATRNASIALGAVALVLTVLLVLFGIRYLTGPLSKLSHRLRRVGTGNFKTKAALEGSSEMVGLSEEVNHMMESVDRLIEHTYVARLNERTAQQIALEAQTNPHFLFNTLQAISAEAIVQGQDGIYRMVSSLAALLRYSVKGDTLVTLETEFSYVEKYLSLQKTRFGENLEYEVHAEDALLPLRIPKLGVLSLAENSIVHGLCGPVDTIHIELSCGVEGDNICLTVRDDGAGIDAKRLREMRDRIDDPEVTISQDIGLTNLAARLKLLYDGRATIRLYSEPGRLTTVTIVIPLEVLAHVQGAAD